MYHTVIPFPLSKYPTKTKLKAAVRFTDGEEPDVDFIEDGGSRHIHLRDLKADPSIKLKVIWKDKRGLARTYAAVSYNEVYDRFDVL